MDEWILLRCVIDCNGTYRTVFKFIEGKVKQEEMYIMIAILLTMTMICCSLIHIDGNHMTCFIQQQSVNLNKDT